KCDGIVVRCDHRGGERSETPYELACMFTSMDGALRERIEEFVTWRNLQALRAALAAAPKDSRPVKSSRALPTTKATLVGRTSVLRKATPRKVAARAAVKSSPAGPSSARSGARKRVVKKVAKRSAGRAQR